MQRKELLSSLHANQIHDVFNKHRSNQKKISLIIDIDSNSLLTRKINLPASTQDNLLDVIKYEMDRYTPFKTEDVYFDCRIEEKFKEKNQIKVLLLVINKKILAPIVSLIKSDEITLRRINVINHVTAEESIHDVKFLRSSIKMKNKNLSTTKWLGFTAFGLILLTSFTPLIINYIKINQLKNELNELEPTIAEVKKLQNEYQEMQQKVGYLVKIKEKNISITHLLNLLTQTMPDHTYVHRMSYDAGLLSLQGLSASASDLIPIMDETGLFEDIRFVAPITQSNVEGIERYSIAAKHVSSGVEINETN